MRFATNDEAATVRTCSRRAVNEARGALLDYMRTDTPRVARIDELACDLADALDLLDVVTA